MTTEDYELTITRLRDELDHKRQQNESLTVAIAEACDTMTGRLDGGNVDDLRDAVGQVNRLLEEGEDLYADLDEGSVAVQIQCLISWAHIGVQAFHTPGGQPIRASVLSQALTDHLNTPLAVSMPR